VRRVIPKARAFSGPRDRAADFHLAPGRVIFEFARAWLSRGYSRETLGSNPNSFSRNETYAGR